MSPAARDPRAWQAWLDSVGSRGYAVDFYQALRRIEAAHPDLPRLGEAVRPADEPVRMAQPADLTFAPTPVAGISLPERGGPVRLAQYVFGLLGPNGPMPTHLTELVRERTYHHADPGLQRFFDTLAHRFALLFYRAWAQAQPVLSLDRAGDTAFARRLGALYGMGEESLLGRDAAGDDAKLLFAGRLARQVRDADGLQNWCRSQFDVPLHIEQWRGHWMALDRDERTRLSKAQGHALGGGAVLGAQTWDVQHKFRIVIGPLRRQQFDDLLPDGPNLERLRAMVRQWLGLEFEWDVQLILAQGEVPPLQLADRPPRGATRLGRSTWLGSQQRSRDAADVVMNPERMPRRRRRPSAPS
jgi:type VI secretion system protein ImpH